MKNVTIKSHEAVKDKFEKYPRKVKAKMKYLRKLVLETATELEDVKAIEETLKWGEPSYIAKKGSTLRMDWKEKNPDQYAMYFKCTSKLVPTIKELYGDLFNYEKNRAIVFELDDKIPIKELKNCIAMALQYHSLKNLPKLGN